MEGWNIMWSSMPNVTPYVKIQKLRESIVSHSKLILVEEIFQNVNRQMLKTN